VVEVSPKISGLGFFKRCTLTSGQKKELKPTTKEDLYEGRKWSKDMPKPDNWASVSHPEKAKSITTSYIQSYVDTSSSNSK
jgi:hypothetical protein